MSEQEKSREDLLQEAEQARAESPSQAGSSERQAEEQIASRSKEMREELGLESPGQGGGAVPGEAHEAQANPSIPENESGGRDEEDLGAGREKGSGLPPGVSGGERAKQTPAT